MKVQHLRTAKGNPAVNQFVINNEDGETVFQSYASKIATYKNGVLFIGNKWDYSVTTLKYFKQFVNDFTCFIYETKKQFEKEIGTNPDILLNG